MKTTVALDPRLIQVLLHYDDLVGMLPGVNDNRILGCAHLLKREGRNVFFISKDINARAAANQSA